MVTINTEVFDGSIREFPGYYDVIELSVNGISIVDQFLQIDHFEWMFGVISARITMVDTRNLIKAIPIIGEETIKMVISDGVNRIDQTFRCYSITNRETLNHNTLKYVMHLASEEMFADSFVRVSKSYYKKKLEDNVKDIISGPDYLNSPKPLLVGDTIEEQCVVIPYWSPIHAVNWMASRARSASKDYSGGTFVFFETFRGFKWVALENLYDSTANRVYATLRYDPMRLSVEGMTRRDSRTKEAVLSIETWKIIKSFNTIENIREGMYANRTTVLDIVNKDFKNAEFNYSKQFHEHTHLDGINGMNAQPLCSADMPALNFPEAHIRVALKHKGLFNDEPEGNSQIEEWLPKKISQHQQLENFVIQAELPGHIGLQVGNIVMFDMPNPQDLSVNRSPGPDEAYSGQYIVTRVRRMFQREGFKLIIEMAKDSRAIETVFAAEQTA